MGQPQAQLIWGKPFLFRVEIKRGFYKETGHVKADCPNSKRSDEKKSKKYYKKKAYIAWEDNASSSSNSEGSDEEEAKFCLMANNDNSDNEVSSSDNGNGNDYDSLYDASQELLAKSSKLDIAHKKLKSDFKGLQRNFEKSLEEENALKNKILSLENREIKTVECASCKSYMFDLMILENQLKNALENKSFEKHVFMKKSKQKQVCS